MSSFAIVAALVVAVSGTGPIPTLGKQACADAEVIASIKEQSPEGIISKDPSIIPRTMLRIQIDVRRVILGRISPGKYELSALSEEFNPEIKQWKMFLRPDSNGHWAFAECQLR